MENENTPEQRDPGQTTTVPILAEQFKEQQLKTFEYNEEYLRGLLEKYKDLKVSGVEDKDGLKAVHEARIVLRDHRTAITKHGKNLREFTNDFNKAVLNRVSDLTSIISPREDEFQELEDDIAAEKERIRQEKEREESAKIDARIKELASVGSAVDFHDLKGMSDEAYAQILEDATAAYKQRLQKEENDRIVREAEERQREEERKAEAERLRLQKEQQDAEARELIRLRKEQAEREQKLREEQEKIEAEKRQLQEEKNNGRKQQMDWIGMTISDNKFIWNTPDQKDPLVLQVNLLLELSDEEFQKVKAGALTFMTQAKERYQERLAEAHKEEAARVEAEKKAAVEKALKDQEEARLKAEAEEIERLAKGDDSYRFSNLAHNIKISWLDSRIWGDMKSVEGKKRGYEVKALLETAYDICRENARQEPPAEL
jgi:hypothetical protein